MPRRCTICTHKKRAAIDQALVARQPFRDIAGQYGVSKSALVRHSDDHIPAELVKAQGAAKVIQADNLLVQVTDLRDRAIGILDTAVATDDLRVALGAIREARGCLELLGKLAGQLQDGPTVNVFLSPEWQTVQVAILQALAPHPGARLAVAAALAASPAHEPGHA